MLEDDFDAENRCLVYIDAFPSFFVSPEILCHQQSRFEKGPDIYVILETPLFARNFISQLQIAFKKVFLRLESL